jgi:hypothetical protein
MASRVHAIETAIVAALKREAAEYSKRNPHPKAGARNEAPREYLLKLARQKVDASGIRDALIEEVLAAVIAE